jgi:hypothetical protein
MIVDDQTILTFEARKKNVFANKFGDAHGHTPSNRKINREDHEDI